VSDGGCWASPEVGWGYADRRVVSWVGSRASMQSTGGRRRSCCRLQLGKQCRVSLRRENNGRRCRQERDRLAMEETSHLGREYRAAGWDAR
jgi:hypothetical protein